MSVQSELARLENAKAAIKAAIEGKGVTVPEATLLDGMAALIESIQAGGGDSAGSVIDKSVTSITSNAAEVGEYAFYGCEMLETASFQMATKIQGGAFVGCKALVSVSAPNVTEITSDVTNYFGFDMDGNHMKDTIGAFKGCINLTTADFQMAKTIYQSAFSGCINLTTVNFPMAETIYQSAFSDCTGLTNLKFPSVKTIGKSDNSGGGIM